MIWPVWKNSVVNLIQPLIKTNKQINYTEDISAHKLSYVNISGTAIKNPCLCIIYFYS